jgi:hypothetical protein
MKAFGTRPEQAAQTRVMAANQGLYNGFLAAGLIWSLLHPDAGFAFQLKLFFLGCVRGCRPVWWSNRIAQDFPGPGASRRHRPDCCRDCRLVT